MTDATFQAVEPAIADEKLVANATEQIPDSSPDASHPGESADKPAKGVQRRIDELTWHRRNLERDVSYWRDMALRNTQPAAPESTPPAQSTVKKLADFNYDEDAFAEYLSERAAEKAAAKLEQNSSKKESEKSRKDKVSKFKEIESKFKTEIDDYEDVAYYARIDDHVVDLVMDMDEGPRIAYYLGKHPDVASRINSLSKDLAAVELGRIDARLAIEREQAKAAKPVSKAPPPPPKIDATDSAVEKDPTQMTDKEFAKWRKQYASKR